MKENLLANKAKESLRQQAKKYHSNHSKKIFLSLTKPLLWIG